MNNISQTHKTLSAQGSYKIIMYFIIKSHKIPSDQGSDKVMYFIVHSPPPSPPTHIQQKILWFKDLRMSLCARLPHKTPWAQGPIKCYVPYRTALKSMVQGSDKVVMHHTVQPTKLPRLKDLIMLRNILYNHKNLIKTSGNIIRLLSAKSQ